MIRMKPITTFIILLSLTSCGTSYKNEARLFSASFQKSEYCQAADIALGEKNVCETNFTSEQTQKYNIDKQLNTGTTLFLAQRNKSSQTFFETSALEIRNSLNSTGIAKGTVSILANSNMLDYSPMIMDSIYLHSYQILNALKLSDKAEAKIQINRAYDSQKNAVQEFNKEINKINKKVAEENQGTTQLSKEQRDSIEKNNSIVLSNYKDLEKWKGYSNFVNPYTTYISGLYFMANSSSKSDAETASTYLKRAAGMSPKNSYLKSDLSLSEKLANGLISKIKPTAWLIFENGEVANFDEFRIDLPIFIVSDEVQTASLALPKPKVRAEAFQNISISNNRLKKKKTQLLADVDGMFISEFNKKLPTLIAKAVTKLVFQTVAQAAIEDQAGSWGSFAMAAYSMATAGADLRSWNSLPKNVQLAKITKTKDGVIYLYAGDKEIAKLETKKDKHSIIYVRIPTSTSTPVIEVIDL